MVESGARFWGVWRSFNLAICACLKRGEQYFLPRAVSSHVPPNQIEKYDLINALRKSREMCQRIEHEPPGKGVCLRSDESHEPRIEIRGMTTRRTPTRPGCLHHSAELPGNAIYQHIEPVLTSDLRVMMVKPGARF